MPKIQKVGEHVQLEVERLDGGLNTKDGPSRIDLTESPDCLNVVFDDRGSVETRQGTSWFSQSNTSETHNLDFGENPVDGLTKYNNTMIVWAGGDMLRASGTTFVTVPSSVGQFSSGVAVAYQQFQGILFCSDGTNGPWRYEGGSDFYKMGIDAPSAPTSVSNVAGDIAADTYYYAVSFINSHAVEGEVGSHCTGVAIAASSVINLSDVPVGTGIQGVAERNIYRATSTAGPFLYVGNIPDNTTTVYTDTVAVGAEGAAAIDDATSPTPFSCIKLHHERLWFPDSSNETLLRYTEYNNPFVSQALSFRPLSRGDGSDIIAIGVQDDLVCVFKENSIWLVGIGDASDDTSFQFVLSPANLGIIGKRALFEDENGIIFVGRRNGGITGFHLLSGISVVETRNDLLRTNSISEKIEADILTWPPSLWSKVAIGTFKNRLYIGSPGSPTSAYIDALYYFDITRLGSDGQPGSWVKWDGVVGCTDFVVLENTLYGAIDAAFGNIVSFNNGTYTDADGSAINSYFWTKQMGGEQSIDSWIKDWRFLNIWYEKLGDYKMDLTYRVDGGGGNVKEIDLDPQTTVWASSTSNPSAVSLVWADSGDGDSSDEVWASDENDDETQHPVGPLVGRRLQVKYDNQNTAGQGFKIHSMKAKMNLRRQR
jgi:hypothetical protein